MTTKEKMKRKAAAKRHRNETPAVIPLPKQESNDLMEAATMKTDVMTEENPGGVIDPAPPVGEPVEARSKTNEELLDEAIESMANEPEPIEVTLSELSLAVRDNAFKVLDFIGEHVKKVHDKIIGAYMAFDDWVDRKVYALYSWADKKNNELSAKWSLWFPPKDYVTRSELMACMEAVATKLAIDFRNTQTSVKVETARLDNLLSAIKSGHKTKAVKFYSELTGANLVVAKNAVEAFA